MDTTHSVLVPFELPDADPVPPVLGETLAAMEVVVLGHYGLPEQTPPTAARAQFEADAQAELDSLAAPFERAGCSVETRLVFGKARNKTIDRGAIEAGCDVVLVPGAVDAVDRVFVPLRGEDNFNRILSFVAELLAATGGTVTLFHAGDESDRRSGADILADAVDRLAEAGVDPDRVDTRLSGAGDVQASIVDLGDDHDVLILGETEPSLRDRVFGTVPAQVSADTTDPVFVVRKVEQS